ncbi:MAG: hypothetical protein R6X27_10315 [Candidatus Desulfacyla sp.]
MSAVGLRIVNIMRLSRRKPNRNRPDITSLWSRKNHLFVQFQTVNPDAHGSDLKNSAWMPSKRFFAWILHNFKDEERHEPHGTGDKDEWDSYGLKKSTPCTDISDEDHNRIDSRLILRKDNDNHVSYRQKRIEHS